MERMRKGFYTSFKCLRFCTHCLHLNLLPHRYNSPTFLGHCAMFTKKFVTTKRNPQALPNLKSWAIAHSRVVFRLCLETGLSAKPFIWKLVLFTCKFWFIYTWIKLIFIWKTFHLASHWNRGEGQLGNGLLTVNDRLMINDSLIINNLLTIYYLLIIDS